MKTRELKYTTLSLFDFSKPFSNTTVKSNYLNFKNQDANHESQENSKHQEKTNSQIIDQKPKISIEKLTDIIRCLHLGHYLLEENLKSVDVKKLYDYLKREVLDKEIFPYNIRELLKKKIEESIYRKALLFLYLNKWHKLPWILDEVETAKLISYIFFYALKKVSNFELAFEPIAVILERPTKKNVSLEVDYEVFEDKKLDAEKIISNIPPLLFDYIFRAYSEFAFIVVYLLFLKDNEELKQLFFSKLGAKALTGKNTQDYIDTLTLLKKVDEYKDYIFLKDHNAINNIKKLCLNSVKEAGKLYIDLVKERAHHFFINQNTLEDFVLFVEKASDLNNQHTEDLELKPQFEMYGVSEIRILYDVSLKYLNKKMEEIENKVRSLGKRLQELRGKTEPNSLVENIIPEYLELINLRNLVISFANDASDSERLRTIGDLIYFIEEKKSNNRLVKKIHNNLDDVIDRIKRFDKDKFRNLFIEALDFQKRLEKNHDYNSLVDEYLNQCLHFIVHKSPIYRNEEKEVLDDLLTRPTVANPRDRKYFRFFSYTYEKLIGNTDFSNEKEVMKVLKRCFNSLKDEFSPRYALALLTYDVVRIAKQKSLSPSPLRKMLSEKTTLLGYLFLTGRTPKVSAKNDSIQLSERITTSVKKFTLLLGIANLAYKYFDSLPIDIMNVLFNFSNSDNKTRKVSLSNNNLRDSYLTGLFLLFMPEDSCFDHIVIDIVV